MRVAVKRTAAGVFAQPEVLVDIVQAVESLGYHSFWLGDHICFPERMASQHPGDPWPTEPEEDFCEALGTAGFLLASTSRLPVGVDALIAPYRNPVLAGKTIATLDHLSQGRVRLAVGAGWMAEVFPALGAPPFASRGRALDEYIEVLRRLFGDDLPSFAGEFYALPPSHFHPRPYGGRRPAIMVGGHSRAARRRAVRLGDGWSAPRLRVDDLRPAIADLRRCAAEEGRAVDGLEISVIANLRFDQRPSDDGYLTGTPEQILAAAAAYRDAGVTELHVNPIGRSGDDVIAALERFRHAAEAVEDLSFVAPAARVT